MVSVFEKRVACLLEAKKRGLCFYQCLASHISADEEEVHELIKDYLLNNQIVVDSVENVSFYQINFVSKILLFIPPPEYTSVNW